jgi:hypothetical protein
MNKAANSRGRIGGLVAGSILLLLVIRGCTYLVEHQHQQQARAAPFLEPLSEQRQQLRLRPTGQLQPPHYLPGAQHPSLELVVLAPSRVSEGALRFERKLLDISKESGRLQWEEDQYSFVAPAKFEGIVSRYTLTYRYYFERAHRAQQPWLIRLTTPADDFQLAKDLTQPPVGDSSFTRSQADSILHAWRTQRAHDSLARTAR